MSVRAITRKVVSAFSVSCGSRWVVCADRKLTLCAHRCADRKHSKLCFYGRAFLFDMEDIMDKLRERAAAFRRLMDYEYKIKLGRKGKLTEIILNFEPSDFFHLIGLHKLTDIINGRLPTEKIFYDCLRGNITYKQIAQSIFFDELGNRFEYFHKLEEMLDSNKIIFKCNTSVLKNFSRITADFELKNIYEALTFYLFIEKRSYSQRQYCKSFIQNGDVNYTYGQTKMTLLYKEKINIKTNERQIQFDRLTPNEI